MMIEENGLIEGKANPGEKEETGEKISRTNIQTLQVHGYALWERVWVRRFIAAAHQAQTSPNLLSQKMNFSFNYA